MSKRAQDQITFALTARRDLVPADSFLNVISSALGILKDIEAQMSPGERRSAQWKVSAASLQSPLTVSLSSQARSPMLIPDVVRAYLNGIEMIEQGVSAAPPYFSSASLGKAKKMVSVLDDGVSRLEISALGRTVLPTQRVAATIDAMAAVSLRSYGSFEGKLETLSVHQATQFMIYDRLSGDSVRCYFDADRWDEAHAAFNGRVRVYGEIAYGRDGKPKTIRVDGGIERLRDNRSIRKVREIEGINITGGIDSAEYVRNMRDE